MDGLASLTFGSPARLATDLPTFTHPLSSEERLPSLPPDPQNTASERNNNDSPEEVEEMLLDSYLS